MRRLVKIIIGSSLVVLAGCATAPQDDPAYVSPTMYQDYSCKQISAEMRRITGKLNQGKQTDATGQVLSAAVMAFGMSQGYSMYSSGDDDTVTRRLANQYDVLEQTAIRKNCSI